MPRARIVIDKFHVSRMANECLEAGLKGICGRCTDIQRWRLMHDRFIMLKRKEKLEGFDRIAVESWMKNYPTWELRIVPSKFYLPFTTPWRRRRELLISGIGRPAWRRRSWPTSTIRHRMLTPSLWTTLSGLRTDWGRGYSFEALRAKILFT